MAQITIHACKFQRKEPKPPASGLKRDVEWETGIFVQPNTGDGIIISMDGEVLKSLWRYEDTYYQGCLIVRD